MTNLNTSQVEVKGHLRSLKGGYTSSTSGHFYIVNNYIFVNQLFGKVAEWLWRWF